MGTTSPSPDEAGCTGCWWSHAHQWDGKTSVSQPMHPQHAEAHSGLASKCPSSRLAPLPVTLSIFLWPLASWRLCLFPGALENAEVLREGV